MKFKIIFKAFFGVFIPIVLILTVGLTVFAADYSFPDEFTVDYTKDGLKSVSKILKTDADALCDYANENDIVLVAVTDDNSVQIRCSLYETDFSKKCDDLSLLDDKAFSLFAESLTGGKYEKEKINGTVYVKISESLADGGGEYLCTQYVTVKDKSVYHFTCFTESQNESMLVLKAIHSVNYEKENTYTSKQKVVIALVIAALSVVTGVMIYSIIKDLRVKE